ncbi:MAG: acetamidase/formamidase family protein [Actinomycetota bacterium]
MARTQTHLGWSRDHPAVLAAPSGSEVSFEAADASGGQLGPGATAQTVAALHFGRVNPVCGPVCVEGARPGDALQVDILAIEPESYGWTAVVPGLGLLADQFPDPWLHVWEFDRGSAVFTDGIRVPFSRSAGCSAWPGRARAPPRHPPAAGGRQHGHAPARAGQLYLPVEVEGALFGAGDTHAPQGDGEGLRNRHRGADDRLSVPPDLELEGPEFDLTRPLERASAAAAGFTPQRESPVIF